MESKVYQVTTNPLETGPLKATLYLTTKFNNELGSEFIADFETEEKANEICAILNQSLRQQPGGVWVKAKPANNGFYAVKYAGGGYGGCGFKDGKWNQSLADNKIDAYLDESAAGREDAVEFLQWVADNGWKPRIANEWARYETIYSDITVKTLLELYELFKQQKER